MKKSILIELQKNVTKTNEINGFEVPLVYSSVETEYKSLREGMGLIDGVGYSILNFTGEDVVNELDKFFTKDITYINPGKITESYVLNENADILGIVFIIKLDESIMVLVEPNNSIKIKQWFKEKLPNSIHMKELNESQHLVFIEGMDTWEVIRDFLHFPVETLPLRQSTTIQFNNSDILLARIGKSGEYGFAFISDNNSILFLVSKLIETYSSIQWVGQEALELCMLEISQPIINQEVCNNKNIFSLNYQWLIQYEKNFYYGKETLFKLFKEKCKKRLVAFICQTSNEIKNGDKIHLFDEEIGEVIFCKYDYKLNGVLGYGYVDKQLAVSGIPLKILSNNLALKAKTISSPYVRPISWDKPIE